jgi:hypothetical protein
MAQVDGSCCCQCPYLRPYLRYLKTLSFTVFRNEEYGRPPHSPPLPWHGCPYRLGNLLPSASFTHPPTGANSPSFHSRPTPRRRSRRGSVSPLVCAGTCSTLIAFRGGSKLEMYVLYATKNGSLLRLKRSPGLAIQEGTAVLGNRNDLVLWC